MITGCQAPLSSCLVHPDHTFNFVGTVTKYLYQASTLFNTKLALLCFYGPRFVHWCVVMLQQGGTIPKLLTQSWEHEIVENVLAH